MYGSPNVRETAQHDGQQGLEIVCQKDLQRHHRADDAEYPCFVWGLVEHMTEIFALWHQHGDKRGQPEAEHQDLSSNGHSEIGVHMAKAASRYDTQSMRFHPDKVKERQEKKQAKAGADHCPAGSVNAINVVVSSQLTAQGKCRLDGHPPAHGTTCYLFHTESAIFSFSSS